MNRIIGADKLKAKIDRIRSRKGPTSYRRALLSFMLKVEHDSVTITPIDTGNLRASGTGNATITSSDSRGASGVVFYTADYAVYVHERTELRHNVGQSKFLETAIKKNLNRMVNSLGTNISYTMFFGK